MGHDNKKFTALSGTRPERWDAAEEPWVFGYFYYDWADMYVGVSDINTVTKTITINHVPHYGLRAGQRWHALNLLEEIDKAGEWYLNRDTGKLYFWPPEPLTSLSDIYVSMLEQALVNISNTSYLDFCYFIQSCCLAKVIQQHVP